MWSLGVILYIVLCGFPPFFEETVEEMYDRIRRVDYSFPSFYWQDVSESAKDLVRKLLVGNPDERYSAAQVVLTHHAA
jgi:serine/threonine protein kinase